MFFHFEAYFLSKMISLKFDHFTWEDFDVRQNMARYVFVRQNKFCLPKTPCP